VYKNGDKCQICGVGRLTKKSIEEKFEYRGEVLIIPDYNISTWPKVFPVFSIIRRYPKIYGQVLTSALSAKKRLLMKIFQRRQKKRSEIFTEKLTNC